MKGTGPVAAAAEQELEVRPSMECFQFLDQPPEAASVGRRRRDRELLQRKVEELERFYAAHRMGREESSGGEPTVMQFNGDLLLKMVDDLERNMKVSRSPESERGRWYGEYSARREVKLREELRLKGAQKRRRMKGIAAKFEQSWEEMMAKNSGEGASAIKRMEQQNSLQKKEGGDFEQEDEEEAEASDTASQKPSATESPINPKLSIRRPPQNPNSTSRTTQPNRNPSSHPLPESSSHRKENMKPPTTKPNMADAPPLPTKSPPPCARSKSTASLRELNSCCSSSDPARKTKERSKSSKALGIEDGSSILHVEMDSEEPRTTREMSKSEEKRVEESPGPAPPQSAMRAEAVRGGKKRGAAERPSAVGSPDNLLRDVGKQFKRMITFGKKRKNGGGRSAAADDAAAAPTTSSDFAGGEEDEARKCSTPIPAYVGLYKGKIFQERVQSPSYSCPATPATAKLRRNRQVEGFPKGSCSLFSFLSFHRRGK